MEEDLDAKFAQIKKDIARQVDKNIVENYADMASKVCFNRYLGSEIYSLTSRCVKPASELDKLERNCLAKCNARMLETVEVIMDVVQNYHNRNVN